jgi:hypothetical protein
MGPQGNVENDIIQASPNKMTSSQGHVLEKTKGLKAIVVNTVLIVGFQRKVDSMVCDICLLYTFRIPKKLLMVDER